MSDSESFSGLVLELAEEFLERYRKGERPPLAEYTQKHPQLADEIREVFPAMAMMENIAIDDQSLAGSTEDKDAVQPALKQLGDYRILKVMGQGGMGVVFLAEDIHLQRSVALKAMLPEVAEKPDAKGRFLREARAVARLEHDNIVVIHHVREERGIPFIVMPLRGKRGSCENSVSVSEASRSTSPSAGVNMRR